MHLLKYQKYFFFLNFQKSAWSGCWVTRPLHWGIKKGVGGHDINYKLVLTPGVVYNVMENKLLRNKLMRTWDVELLGNGKQQGFTGRRSYSHLGLLEWWPKPFKRLCLRNYDKHFSQTRSHKETKTVTLILETE